MHYSKSSFLFTTCWKNSGPQVYFIWPVYYIYILMLELAFKNWRISCENLFLHLPLKMRSSHMVSAFPVELLAGKLLHLFYLVKTGPLQFTIVSRLLYCCPDSKAVLLTNVYSFHIVDFLIIEKYLSVPVKNKEDGGFQGKEGSILSPPPRFLEI